MKKLFVVLAMLAAMNASGQWVQYTLPYYGFACTLGFYDLNRGISFGHTLFPANENMYYTTNSGVSWIKAVYPPELRAIADVQFINASTVYASGSENVIVNKIYMQNNDFIKFPGNIRERLIREGKREFYSEYKSAFIKSTDGGLNWYRGSQFDTLTGYVMDINFFNANTGYALIDSNSFGNTRFYKTTNTGANWQFISRVDTSAEVEKMVFFDMNTGIAKGFNSGGRIYKTTNAGLNWTVKVMPTQIDCITFYNSTTGIAAGIAESGAATTIYRTTDAGSQWNIVLTIPGRQFQNIQTLPSTGTAFAVGNTLDTATLSYGKITTIKTTNFGLNWVLKEFNPIILVYGLAIVDANNYFISGGDIYTHAQILKSTNGGNVFINQIGSSIPSSYSLRQNYPNPFNAMCNVQFSMCKEGDVKIIVYDVMGREIETLVNERLKAGVYDVKFDGSMLTSGVYFCKLKTVGFSVVKKMTLIK